MLFAVSAVAAGVVWSHKEWCLLWLRSATYFTLLALTCAWLARFFAWARARWSSPACALRANWPEVLLALCATTALFLTHDWAFRP